MSVIERIWFDDSIVARSARLALAPPAWLYASIVRVRGALFDRGLLHVHRSRRARARRSGICRWEERGRRRSPRGRRNVCVMRARGQPSCSAATAATRRSCTRTQSGHSGHRRPRSSRRAQKALAAGADCAILDDGFQHRRLARTVDWVLVSAEQPPEPARLLPAGPWRKPPSALGARQLRSSRGRAHRSRSPARSLRDSLPATATDCAIVHRRRTMWSTRATARPSDSSVLRGCAR